MSADLRQLQKDIAGRLESLEALAYVPVLVVRPESAGAVKLLQTQIDQTLAGLLKKSGKAGAAVIVQMPTVDAPEPEVPGPQLEVVCAVRVLENPVVNMGASGTLTPAEDLGLAVLQGLHHWNPGQGSVIVADRRAMEPNNDFPGKVVYDCYPKTTLGLRPPARVARPVISVAGAVPTAAVTLSCPTGGAAIRYTVDGSFPGPAATLYTTPFNMASAARVRAAAYLAGSQGSDVTEKTIS
jgi:hypothetical protein